MVVGIHCSDLGTDRRHLLYKGYKSKSEQQRHRGFALEKLEDVRLAGGEAAAGLLYFAPADDPAATFRATTLVVPVRRADGANESVRLRLR